MSLHFWRHFFCFVVVKASPLLIFARVRENFSFLFPIDRCRHGLGQLVEGNKMLIEKFSSSLLPKSNSAHLRWIPKARARNSPSLCCVVLRAPRKPNFRERYRKYLEKCSTQNFANISSERHRHESTSPPITERRVKIEQKLTSSYRKIPFNRFCRCTDF